MLNVIMPSMAFIYCNSECCNVKCRYPECYNAECCGAIKNDHKLVIRSSVNTPENKNNDRKMLLSSFVNNNKVLKPSLHL